MIKCLIFDFDLTLVDSKHVARLARKELETEHGISSAKLSEAEIWGGTYRIFSEKVKNFNNTNLNVQEIEELIIKYATAHYLDAKLISKDLLKKWQGKYRLAIVSGNTKEVIEKVLGNNFNKGLKFYPILETNSGHTKANRIKECLEILNINSDEALYIGDHLNDINAAKEAGVKSVAVCTGFHTKEELVPYSPDVIINELEELDKYLVQMENK